MCLGNRAEPTISFLNHQYQALYENAERCTEHYVKGRKPGQVEIEHGTFLYECFGPGRRGGSKDDVSYWFKFEKAPRLSFICKHEAILYFYIKEGQYLLETKKGSSKSGSHNSVGKTVLAFKVNYEIQRIKVIESQLVDNNSHPVEIFILNTSSAEIISELCKYDGDVTEGGIVLPKLRGYFKSHYLEIFKRAGHHVLYSLPNFGNYSNASIDFSVLSSEEKTFLDASSDFSLSLLGVSVENINTYLKGQWLQAASDIDEHGSHLETEGRTGIDRYYAEHNGKLTIKGEEIEIELHFGPMKVKALCQRELILYIDMQDVHLSIKNAPEGLDFNNWKLAYILDVDLRKDTQDRTQILLDRKSARFCEHLSSIVQGDALDIESFSRYRDYVKRYLVSVYFEVIFNAGHYTIYREGFHVHESHHESGADMTAEYFEDAFYELNNTSDTSFFASDAEVEFGCTCINETTCLHKDAYFSKRTSEEYGRSNSFFIRWGVHEKRRVSSSLGRSYDHVTAISQNGINICMRDAWQASQNFVASMDRERHSSTWSKVEIERASLSQYSLVLPDEGLGDQVLFSAIFKTPMVQLVVDEREIGMPGGGQAILYLWLAEGYLKTLGKDKEFITDGAEHRFNDWHLAFTVDLKLEDGANNSKIFLMDLLSAKFNQELSYVHGLLEGEDYRLIRKKREALVFYVTNHYFPTLVDAKYHILYNFSLSGLNTVYGEAGAAVGLTSLTFQIYPFTFKDVNEKDAYLDGLYGEYGLISARNSILFLGMTANRPAPERGYFYRGTVPNFIVGTGKNIPHGSIVASRFSFLESHLLKLLADINRNTTIMSSFAGVNDDAWILKITKWGEHEVMKTAIADWKGSGPDTQRDDKLQFDWSYRDLWNHEREGPSYARRKYAIECNTHNELVIPATINRGSLDIAIKGEVRIELHYSGEQGEWKSFMIATWSANVQVSPQPSGDLSVTVSPAIFTPDFVSPDPSGSFDTRTLHDVFAQLKDELRNAVDVEYIARGMKAYFNDVTSQLHSSTSQYVAMNPSFNCYGDLIFELRFTHEEEFYEEESWAHSAAEYEHEDVIHDAAMGYSTSTDGSSSPGEHYGTRSGGGRNFTGDIDDGIRVHAHDDPEEAPYSDYERRSPK